VNPFPGLGGGPLFRAGRRHLARNPWQLVLSVLGVALGVAVVVAMDLAIQSSREAFRVSSETVTGRATHQVLGGVSGLPDSLLVQLRMEGGVSAAAPVVDAYVTSPRAPGRALRLLGVDPFSEGAFRPWLAGGPTSDLDGSLLLSRRGAVVLGRELAEVMGLKAEDPMEIGTGEGWGELQVVGVLEARDRASRLGLQDLLIVDLAEAQEQLGRLGRLDRIDLILSGEEDAGAREAAVMRLLPPGARLERAGSREATMAEMIRAFDLNLTALSLLSLVFGVFLIYNAMTFSVVQRRRTLGTFRALGATRGQVMLSILGEALLLGVMGSFLGLLAGIGLGRGLVRLVTRTINDLYFVVSVEGLALPPGVLLKGAALGIGATLLAALPPVWEAGAASPREAMARSSVESRVRRTVPLAAGIGTALAAAGTGLILFPTQALLPAFIGLFGIILGMALLTPLGTVLLVGALRPLLRRTTGVLGAMAARGVVTSLSRTAPAVAALVIAVSVTVGLGIMIQSFRGSVVQWLDATLQADLYVSTPSAVSARADGELPPGAGAMARNVEGVQGLNSYRGVELLTDYGMTRLVALDLDPLGDAGIDLIGGRSGGDQVFEMFRAGDGVLVSEPFAFRQEVGVGDTIRLEGDRNDLALPLLGVYRDYGSETGAVMMSRAVYDLHWEDAGVTSLGLFLEPDADERTVATALREALGTERPLVVRSNSELRELSLEVFDRTFAVTRVLRLLAFGVAFIAILSALMALQLERRREFGVLRANGMTPRQGWGLITAQTGIMGAVAGVLAIPVGLMLAVVMILVVNRRSFGWTLEMQVGVDLVLQAVALALVGALLAGLYPSWRLGRTSPAEALRGE